MCEIAILPAQHSENEDSEHFTAMVEVARTLYETNSHGVGVVAVNKDEEDGTFNYRIWKAVDPSWDGLQLFFETFAEDTWRFIIHARLATAGGKGIPETHPISTRDCPETNINYVVHNGVVRGARFARERLEEDGHEFATEVDSEVIPHKWEDVPEGLEDVKEPRLNGRLNYILLGDERILVRNTGKYNIREDMQMTCSRRGWSEFPGADKGMHLFTPDGEYEYSELPEKESISTKGARGYRGRGVGQTFPSNAGGNSGTRTGSEAESDEEAENRTFTYYAGAEDEPAEREREAESCSVDDNDVDVEVAEDLDRIEAERERAWAQIKQQRAQEGQVDWEEVGRW